jgi:hypothetical protein
MTGWRPPQFHPGSLWWERIEGYVDHTIAWLDEHEPDWPAKINLDIFEDADLRYCVLGQVYGGYWNAPYQARQCWPFGLGDSEQPTVEAVWRERLKTRTTSRQGAP